MTSYPHHDRFVRGNLADIAFSRRFFRLLLEQRVLKEIDLEKLEMCKDSFIDKNLNAIFTDLLFIAPYAKHKACITILIEHKSEGTVLAPGCDLPWQLRCQEIAVMKDFRRNHPQNQAPIVWLIGLYHGRDPYQGPLTVAENMHGPKELIPKRWKEKDMQLIDLCSFSDEELAVGGKLSVFLLILKHIYDENILERVSQLLPEMQELDVDQDGRNFLISVFTYLFEASSTEKQEEIEQFAVQSLSKETKEGVMTIAEKLRAEGKKEGKKEGEKNGIRKVAQRMLKKGLDLATVSECSGLTIETLKTLKNT